MYSFFSLLCAIGLGFYCAGCARSKNTVSALFRALIVICTGILAYWALGEAIRTSTLSRLLGWDQRFAEAGLLGAVLIPAMAVNGAIMERSRAYVPAAITAMLCGVLLPVIFRLSYGNWRMHYLPWLDTGALSIYLPGGCVALVAIKLVGPRSGKYNQDGSTNNILGHSIPLALAGVFLLLFASPIYITGNFSEVGSLLAASSATLVATAYSRLRLGRIDLPIVCTGCLGGLVSISGLGGNHSPLSSFLIGTVAGLIVPWSALLLDLRFKIDDPIAAVSIFGVGGVWASIATALFAPIEFRDRMEYLGVQLGGIALIAAISLVSSLLFLGALRATVGLRCRPGDELDGLDLAEHDANAYPDFHQTMIKSYHLREM